METNQANRIADRTAGKLSFREVADAQEIVAAVWSGRCPVFRWGTVPPSAWAREHPNPIVKSLAMSVIYLASVGSTVIHLAAPEAGQV